MKIDKNKIKEAKDELKKHTHFTNWKEVNTGWQAKADKTTITIHKTGTVQIQPSSNKIYGEIEKLLADLKGTPKEGAPKKDANKPASIKNFYVFCDGSAPAGKTDDGKPGYFCAIILEPCKAEINFAAGSDDILSIGPKHKLAAVLCGHHQATTSPRMEFVAAFEALGWIKKKHKSANVTVVSDHENLIEFLKKDFKCTAGCQNVVEANGGKLVVKDGKEMFENIEGLTINAKHVNASHASKQTKPTHFANQISDFWCTFVKDIAPSPTNFKVFTITEGQKRSNISSITKRYI